jgi:hypothetical protein
MTIAATVVGGVLTCLYDPVPYKRSIMSLVVRCSAASVVNVYAGIVADSGLIESNLIGANNSYNPTNPSIIQAGYPIYVQWPDAAVGASASAVIVFEGEY